MGKGFNIKTAFKHSKQSKPQIVIDDEDEEDIQKTSKRNAFHDFFRMNTQKLPRSMKRVGKRKTQLLQLEPPSRPYSQYQGQRPLSVRPASQVIMPPPNTKEPAILASWGAKSPSLRPDSFVSQTMTDSVTGRHQPARSPLSMSSFPRPEAKPLSQEDVAEMFRGAPQFEIMDSATRPWPNVTFGGRTAGDCDAENDFADFSHPTFAAASLAAHGLLEAVGEDGSSNFDLRESPDMRSVVGKDAGTVGLAHFLQLPSSDSKLTEENRDTMAKRVDLLVAPSKLGLQPLDLASIIDRLTELSEEYLSGHSTLPTEKSTAEMYTNLFSRLLTSPKYSSTGTSEEDPTGLEVQIAALTQVLNASDIWYDFGYVEWRIRVGQLLWSEIEDQGEAVCERDLVLLQITLASELLIRLKMSDLPLQSRLLSKKVMWDLILALRFLENIKIAQRPVEEKQENRNSVFSAMTFFTANESPEEPILDPVFYPRHEQRQLDGLLKFAETLSWPHTKEISQRFQNRRQKNSLLTPGPAPVHGLAVEVYSTSVASSDLPGYSARPQVGRTSTAQSTQLFPASTCGLDSLNVGGWMSRSWLTGLVLPGEAASHFLISTLLENSPRAIKALGDSANLYGGFMYAGRSYWSRSCIVGRVLAAQNGANDCMGWVSSPSIPKNSTEEWVSIEAKELPEVSPLMVVNPCGFVQSNNSDMVEEDDFTWPVDSPPIMGNEARYEGLTLAPTSPTKENSLQPSTAHLNFASKSSKNMKLTIPLTHDVNFVSSCPCFPEPRSRPSSSHNDIPSLSPTDEKELPDPPCHPLHSGYSMEIVPAATLLSFPMDSYKGEDSTLVLDCRGSNELELLSKAWCAQIGENALVGKTNRTCLSCCVREACGMGIKIVIRI